MNQQKIKKIKSIIKFNKEDPVHKRLIRRLKKEYQKLPSSKKISFIEQLEEAFKGKEVKS